MYPKTQIEDLVKTGNGELAQLVSQQSNGKGILNILENLGYLPSSFDTEFLLDFVDNENPKVRLLAIKNLAKLNRIEFLTIFWDAFRKETDTTTRREIVSAIGKAKKTSKQTISFQILEDEDPKVVCQAIRGLLVYNDDDSLKRRLKPLMDHPNEIVRNVIIRNTLRRRCR